MSAAAASPADQGARIGPGAFIAVVGASGVGKDALISYVRERLDDQVHFPRRVITRPAGAGEDHEPFDESGFEDACAAGAFAVSWRAHGLGYGIPATADHHVRDGRAVVANVSRAVLAPLAERYANFVVVRIVVSEAVRELRLRTRKREESHDIAARLARVDPAPEFPVDVEVQNDGTIAEGGEQLLSAIRSVLQPA
ncbi:phosphonate metabolism protein/1,5-bisphosphokinase (PRPP-forming) PhnN [Gryllotalpicola daejeonensis]|uniref:Ribose 1,5-bisphosphate phosphokinase PhnN n=1 Tax=Gryllotalpicola daejeonensis TaxID=993087 RepID=A0ABP7ZLY9_9MICO